MRLSKYFLPLLKENPKEAEIISHRLMLRSGMIKQHSSGIYSWLPLGKRVLDKVCKIVCEEQIRAGASELLMPTLQSADIWQESGRYDDYGLEMLRIKDRHDREMLYGPTNEEMVTDIFRNYVKSYKQLPVSVYQIQWKFRDELRPRFGVMRGREFLMKDAYSFDISPEAAKDSYNKMFVAYLRTFARMGMDVIPMRADTGPIGGNLSHEFIVLASTGESQVFCDKKFIDYNINAEKVDFNQSESVAEIVSKWTSLYAATEEMHDENIWSTIPGDSKIEARGIEVGHIFYFGTKYSEPMRATVMGHDGKEHHVFMGSYGLGITRIIAAAIEASHDENGIIWHPSIAPFEVGIINMRPGDTNCDALSNELYGLLSDMGIDVLFDDTNERSGVKFSVFDLIGLPYQVIIGPRLAVDNKIEIKDRRTSERFTLNKDEAYNFIRELLNKTKV